MRGGEQQSAGLYTAQGRRKYLNADERRRFLAAAGDASPEVRAFCFALAYLGVRISEALALTPADIQLHEGVVSVRSLKKRGRLTVRELPAAPALLSALEIAFAVAGRQGDPAQASLRFWPWGRVTAWRLIGRVLAAAGVGGSQAMPKGLRHGFGVHAVQCGVPLTLIQRWLGHADVATTAIYTHVLGPEEHALARRMW